MGFRWCRQIGAITHSFILYTTCMSVLHRKTGREDIISYVAYLCAKKIQYNVNVSKIAFLFGFRTKYVSFQPFQNFESILVNI